MSGRFEKLREPMMYLRAFENIEEDILEALVQQILENLSRDTLKHISKIKVVLGRAIQTVCRQFRGARSHLQRKLRERDAVRQLHNLRKFA